VSKLSSNWYDRKWQNRRAVKAKARRAEKYGHHGNQAVKNLSGSDADAERRGLIAEVRSDGTCVITDGERFYNSRTSFSVVVGDRVGFTQRPGIVEILEVFPRLTKLVRMRADASRRSTYGREEHVLAANVDVAVIVASAASPPFHQRLIDRYLVMCQYGGIEPVICINKIDLVPVPPDLHWYTAMDIPVVYVSASTSVGLRDLEVHLRGKCAVLTGQSGVGKSTIFNALLNQGIQRIGDLSRDTRGKHTTTSSLLHKLDDTTHLIDTPGIRSLGLWDVDKETLRFYFPDFMELAVGCKYRDCHHTHEPDCAVKAAVKNGAIPLQRYDSYLRLMNE
jgi:ribosome biogenesis GTPase